MNRHDTSSSLQTSLHFTFFLLMLELSPVSATVAVTLESLPVKLWTTDLKFAASVRTNSVVITRTLTESLPFFDIEESRLCSWAGAGAGWRGGGCGGCFFLAFACDPHWTFGLFWFVFVSSTDSQRWGRRRELTFEVLVDLGGPRLVQNMQRIRTNVYMIESEIWIYQRSCEGNFKKKKKKIQERWLVVWNYWRKSSCYWHTSPRGVHVSNLLDRVTSWSTSCVGGG